MNNNYKHDISFISDKIVNLTHLLKTKQNTIIQWFETVQHYPWMNNHSQQFEAKK